MTSNKWMRLSQFTQKTPDNKQTKDEQHQTDHTWQTLKTNQGPSTIIDVSFQINRGRVRKGEGFSVVRLE